ncbi:MAG: hypothetical protein K8R23_04155, partial [Chthoniobacter sp.]|nr:hypothetical protein [Chthoniobacter sp.]
TPRRSPRQAFGGNKARPRHCGKQPQTNTSTNPPNYSFELSTKWGQVTAFLQTPDRYSRKRWQHNKENYIFLAKPITTSFRKIIMVKVLYKARLGNNLFQYCLGRILAEELGFELQADSLPGFANTAQQVPGASHSEPEQELLGQKIDFERILADQSPRKLLVHGWFQRFEYYRAYRDQIRHWLTLDPSIQTPDLKPQDLVVNVRRGVDYFEIGWLLPFSFYEEAIERLLPANGNVWIVTDDPIDPFFWRFKRWHPKFFRGNPLEHLAFLKKAPKLIISQSSFSWWPTFLGNDREIVCPTPNYGIWCNDTEGVNLIERDRFICIDCSVSYQPNRAEKVYYQARSFRRRLVQKLNRDLGLSLPEPKPW